MGEINHCLTWWTRLLLQVTCDRNILQTEVVMSLGIRSHISIAELHFFFFLGVELIDLKPFEYSHHLIIERFIIWKEWNHFTFFFLVQTKADWPGFAQSKFPVLPLLLFREAWVYYSSIGPFLLVSIWQSHLLRSITLCLLPVPVMPQQPLSGILMENDMLVGSSEALLQWPITCPNEMEGRTDGRSRRGTYPFRDSFHIVGWWEKEKQWILVL